MDVIALLHQVDKSLTADSKGALKQQLAFCINELLLHDFSSLVQLLYQVDVPEQKLKTVLKENPHEDAGNIIADLIIQRQQEKAASRKNYLSSNPSDEEKW